MPRAHYWSCSGQQVDPATGLRRCSQCETVKALSLFSNSDKKGHRSSRCRKCVRQNSAAYYASKGPGYYKRWRSANADKVLVTQRRHHLKKRGMSEADYQALLERQNGVCATCPQPPGKKRLAVDHDHDTDVIRGLLCSKCNTAIGLLNDDPALIRRVADYVERNQAP